MGLLLEGSFLGVLWDARRATKQSPFSLNAGEQPSGPEEKEKLNLTSTEACSGLGSCAVLVF